MHLALPREVTQADADPCIRPSTYCCCIHSSKMLAHSRGTTTVTVTRLDARDRACASPWSMWQCNPTR